MIKHKYVVVILVIILVVVLSGCSGKKPTNQEDVSDTITTHEGEGDQNSDLHEEDHNNQQQASEDKQIEEKVGIPSPLSGRYAPEEKINRRPVAIMFDNHPRARWQAGLGQAEIVYEFLVEYPYSRYMGIFLINEPEHIGPIRSARPYFVTALLEYDPIYVRVGGSEAAKQDVKDLKIADIDGLQSSSQVFWRYYETGKTIPNNMYSSMKAIRKEQERRSYRRTAQYQGFNFNEEDSNISGITADSVLITYNKDNKTKYEFDEDKRVYTRYKDGKLHIDEYDNNPITAKNIIIQKVATEVIDNVGRLELSLVGKGKGLYVTNGKAMEITWEKSSRTDKTYYYDLEHNEISFNAGVTWIQVTQLNPNIEIK